MADVSTAGAMLDRGELRVTGMAQEDRVNSRGGKASLSSLRERREDFEQAIARFSKKTVVYR
jgi:hypothetical protein